MRNQLYLLLILLILLSGCAGTVSTNETSDHLAVKAGEPKVLAGSQARYLEFSKKDYENALNDNKKILLYFYANWCPLCKKEQKETFAAFNELHDSDWIGFRVNYKDSDTDKDEEDLAREFGISYQHTKVLLKDGKAVLKAPDSWDKQRYLEEIAKV